ncbi:MAG: signal transduction histidine kinase [Glaciihabitans sp.]|nr:signal transduction histidine kinase [Glaciihabitans sp.]
MRVAREYPVLRPWRSVRVRLLTGLVIISALGLVGGGSTTFLIQRARILSGVDSNLSSEIAAARSIVLGAANSRSADSTSPASKPQPFRSATTALNAVVGRVLPDTSESSLGILNGRATYVPGVTTSFHLEDIPGFVTRIVTLSDDGRVHIGTVASRWGPLRYVAAPLTVTGSSDKGIFVVASRLDVALGDLTGAFQTYWMVAAAAIVIVGSLGWFIAGRLLRPIHTLRLAASRVTSSHRGERIAVTGNDDISQLTMTVNLMLDRLDEAITDQRQLLEDVRHELHTPITIVRGHLEVIDPNDPADVLETRALAIEELDRVSGLVEDLALLADAQREPPRLEVTDVAKLTKQIFAKVSVLPDHTWTLTDIARISSPLDRARITQAWLQLVDNAAKYSPIGSPIELGSTNGTAELELWVEDHGRGVPAEAAARIFERFGRADPGRGVGGSGLGLSIVETIALSHGGRVTFDSSPERTRFSLLLPHATASTAAESSGKSGSV